MASRELFRRKILDYPNKTTFSVIKGIWSSGNGKSSQFLSSWSLSSFGDGKAASTVPSPGIRWISQSASTAKVDQGRKLQNGTLWVKSVGRECDGFFLRRSCALRRGYSTHVDVPLLHPVWQPPPRGTFKANTAGSYKKDEWASVGVVIRDHNGVCDRALFDSSDGDSCECDIKCDAVIAAQEFAIELGIKSLIIESDYLHLVDALRTNVFLKSKRYIAKEQKIRMLEKQFDYCDYRFVTKKGNSPAKIIAGLKLKGRKVFEKPSDIEEIDKREYFERALDTDSAGTIYTK